MSVLTYYAKTTTAGLAAIANAVQSGEKVKITHFAAGDGGGAYYRPTGHETKLQNECWRGVIDKYELSKVDESTIILTAVIPNDVGGFTIREMGVFAEDNTLIAIGNCPDFPKIANGQSNNEFILKMKIRFENIEAMEVVADNRAISVFIEEAKEELRKEYTEELKPQLKEEVHNEWITKYTEELKPELKNEIHNELRNPNLLINGDLYINQRGITAYTENMSYTVDRWQMLGDGGTVTPTVDGVVLSGITSTNQQLYIKQILETYLTRKLRGKQVTFSVKLKAENHTSGSIFVCIGYSKDVNDGSNFNNINTITKETTTGDWEMFTVTATVPEEAELLFVQVGSHYESGEGMVNEGCVMTIKECKLEKGSFATPFEPPLYSEELAKCQRYCISGFLKGINFITSEGTWDFIIFTPTTLRTTPTVVNGDKIYVYDEGNVSYNGLDTQIIEVTKNCIALKVFKGDYDFESKYINIMSNTWFDAEIY